MKILKLIVGIIVLTLFTSSCYIISPSQEAELPIDVSTVTLRSTYSINGEPFPKTIYTTAFFSLRSLDNGDTVALGDSNDQYHSTMIIPGVYDVIYTYTQGSDIPQNQDAIVKAAVTIDADQVLEIDVPAVTLTSSHNKLG